MARECINQISISKKKSFTSTFSNMDADGLDLLRKLLVFNPSNRLTAEQALSHPYLKDFHDPSEEISYHGTIKIPIDQNTKFSIKEYREALYRQIAVKSKKKTMNYNEMTKSITQNKTNIQKRCDTEKRQKSYNGADEYKRVEDLQKRDAKRDSMKRK